MPKKPSRTAAGPCLLFLALWLPLAVAAQDAPAPAPAPAGGAAPAPEGQPGSAPPADAAAPVPAAAAPATAPGPDPAALARVLGAERRVMRTDAGEFGVIVANSEKEQASGTLLLLPADGQFPGASPGIARLREEMPVTGWATWLVELEAPPRVQSLGAPEAPSPPAEGATPSTEAGKSEAPAEKPAAGSDKPAGEPAAPEPPAETPEAPADGGAAAAVDTVLEAPGLALDKRLGAAHADWIARNRARVAAALSEAVKTGPVVLVAEGSASPVLAAALEKAEGLAALVLLAPVALDEAPFAWPSKLALPVLEVLEPGASPEERAGSLERARAAGVGNHRLMLLSLDGPSVGPRESLLTRRVRGWLTGLARRDDG